MDALLRPQNHHRVAVLERSLYLLAELGPPANVAVPPDRMACLFEETGYHAGPDEILAVIAEEDFRQATPFAPCCGGR